MSPTVLRLALALFAIQAGFHGYTASLPLALSRVGTPDPTIGLIMGTAAIVQIPASLVGGRLVDRFGGTRMLTVGAIAYLAATAVLLVPTVDPGGSPLPYVIARILQGAGIGLTLPSALSIVPRMVPAERQALGIAFIGSAHNLTLVVLPTLSLMALDAASLHGVGLLVTGFVAAGLLLSRRLPMRAVVRSVEDDARAAAGRRFGITFRRSWTVPLLIIVTYVAHWGVVTAYLPTRAEAAGADIGLFFAADGLAIFAMRVPTGWLAGRTSARALIVGGALMTMVSVALLLVTPDTGLLVLAGFLGGTGGAFVMTPILVEMSRRSSDLDRGSAFALFSGCLAAALSIGSVGASPLIAVAGFEAALVVGLAGIAVAVALALSDPALRVRGGKPAATDARSRPARA